MATTCSDYALIGERSLYKTEHSPLPAHFDPRLSLRADPPLDHGKVTDSRNSFVEPVASENQKAATWGEAKGGRPWLVLCESLLLRFWARSGLPPPPPR